MGRGVHTARDFAKACCYATPHVFEDDGLTLMVRTVSLAPYQTIEEESTSVPHPQWAPVIFSAFFA